MTDKIDFGALEEILGHRFSDRSLLLTAFTHSSYAAHYGTESNERLEFLGDAVLELIVTEMLICTSSGDEGKLTELRKQYVSRSALEKAEARARLMPHLLYEGSGENIGGKTASNLFEAAIGALYPDGGMPCAKRFLKKYLSVIATENYKTLLQEFVQERQREMPEYHVRGEAGHFECTVSAMGMEATGMGGSKKAAETAAARELYEKLRKDGTA